jgi:hypothetical protein
LDIEPKGSEILPDYSPDIGIMKTQQFCDDEMAETPDKDFFMETGKVIQSSNDEYTGNLPSVIFGKQDIDVTCDMSTSKKCNEQGPAMENMDFETNDDDRNEKVEIASNNQRDSGLDGVWKEGNTENIQSQITGDKFECFCGKKFTWKKQLKKHQKTHEDSFTDSLQLQCSTCGKQYSTKKMRDDPFKTVSQGYYFVCPLCYKTNPYRAD